MVGSVGKINVNVVFQVQIVQQVTGCVDFCADQSHQLSQVVSPKNRNVLQLPAHNDGIQSTVEHHHLGVLVHHIRHLCLPELSHSLAVKLAD